jgi:hypothetical protein
MAGTAQAPRFIAWTKRGRRWAAVAAGETQRQAHDLLLEHVRKTGQVPVSSAVLPVGVSPAERGGRG